MATFTAATLLDSQNPQISNIMQKIKQIGSARTSILLYGESGTGKEIFAHHIHNSNNQSKRPFVAINCSAIQENLLESELFGHVKGAFTGAVQNKKGVFELAHGGTLFLDEIGELPLHLQPKILRAIETGTIRPVGSEQEISVDIRLISATNRDLQDMVNQEKFREDLYYRINVIHFTLPPLRERREDIPLFVHFFMRHFSALHNKDVSTISENALETLQNYSFPGNIRELKNIIDYAIVFCPTSEISLCCLPEAVRKGTEKRVTQHHTAHFINGEHIETVLSRFNGNISRAAKALGIHRSTIHRRIRKLKTV